MLAVTAMAGAETTSPAAGEPASTFAAELVGWATQNGGTTGGAGGETVQVDSVAAFTEAVTDGQARVVEVTGALALPDMTPVGSNKTIVGVGGDATITGGGLTLSESTNVIIQNLTFDDWNDDAINIEDESTNVWVDHNSFGVGFDGAVDIKRGSDFITVSWNRVTGHNKVMLLGHSDNNGAQDIGKLRVTYHHNFFEGTVQRNPRVRFGNPVHVFNNLYQDVSGYGVASTEDAGVLVEGNVFVGVDDPFHLAEAASGPGTLIARDNLLLDSGTGEAGGDVADIPYAYQLDPASEIEALVTAGAGAGRL
ncbi:MULTISPECIES: pectate lyase [unclassified Solwaraspora]|uniref:pectate lyase family protein n=1 Tax=unclassified Solwaraspora TaxID=2627926 RepID=UPI00248BD689|nr:MULTISPECIES: pectate lyase [unclassified Solwaraspora]WBB99058.1 pectate lyase [Solwaraspora sp. WMMA2059]WBC22389.1 pectate lyase [Solwaraspora sp. WMMA2080]WJK35562.1 pectate lyase [Solwaraspora sp. WMMA2065]